MKNLINIVAFQGVWFTSVLGAAHGRPWLGALAFVPFLAWQLRSSSDPGYDLRALITLMNRFACQRVSGLHRRSAP